MKKTLKAWRFLLGCVLLVVAFAFFHLLVADYLAGPAAAWFADVAGISSPYELALR